MQAFAHMTQPQQPLVEDIGPLELVHGQNPPKHVRSMEGLGVIALQAMLSYSSVRTC